jgi:hypothetical protein
LGNGDFTGNCKIDCIKIAGKCQHNNENHNAADGGIVGNYKLGVEK